MTENRKYIIFGLVILVSVVFAIKLFWIQILDPSYKLAAANNALQKIVEFPYRGVIYDRNNKIMVFNVPVYDIMVIHRETSLGMDTAGFCKLLRISKPDFIIKMKEARKQSRVRPYPIVKQLSNLDFARIQDQLIDFPGFFIMPRTVRNYPAPIAANALGYIGEISKKKLESQPTSYYKMGDYVGISGLEAHYETWLRGRKGVKHMMVDVHGVQKGHFKNGDYDTTAIRGENLHTGLDMDLQAYAELLMTNKAGSIVALEPQTGEVLAFVSSPSYNPNLLTAREFGANYYALFKNPLKPLFNRPLMAPYPPGSIFKVIQALIALQDGVIDSNTVIPCRQDIVHCHPHPNPCNLHQAVQWSCNPYFLNVYRRIINRGRSKNTFADTHLGYQHWTNHVASFGVGTKLGIDMPSEKGGILRPASYFDKVYGNYHWKYSNIYSMSIGQGEIGMSPLQMANLAAIMANRGYFYTPHFARSIGEKGELPAQYRQKNRTTIDSVHYEIIINGMADALRRGTVWSQARLKSVVVCGKTGTAQNPQGKDHSVFICFAPKHNPKIALAVLVEHGGWGGFVAAPIGTLLIEKYLYRNVKRKNLENHMINQDFINLKKDSTSGH